MRWLLWYFLAVWSLAAHGGGELAVGGEGEVESVTEAGGDGCDDGEAEAGVLGC